MPNPRDIPYHFAKIPAENLTEDELKIISRHEKMLIETGSFFRGLCYGMEKPSWAINPEISRQEKVRCAENNIRVTAYLIQKIKLQLA